MLSGNFAKMTTYMPFRDLLHAANLRHGTDGFTSPPMEGVLRIFFADDVSGKNSHVMTNTELVLIRLVYPPLNCLT